MSVQDAAPSTSGSLDLINDVIKKNNIKALNSGLAGNKWLRRQLVDGLFAAATYRKWECLEILIDGNVPLQRYNKKGQTVLHRLVMNCHPDETFSILQRILDKTSKGKSGSFDNFINKRCNMSDGLTGYTVLHQAVMGHHIKCVNLLLECGAKANIRSGFYQRTALMEAANKGNIDVVTLLLKHRAQVHIVDKGGQTALIYAAQNGKLACVNKLLEAKCNVNTQNYTGNSALMQAAWNGHIDCIQVLLEAKADVYSTDFLGRSVLRYAVKSRKREVLDLILDAFDEIPEDLSIGKAVVELDDTTMLETLLQRGMVVKSDQSGDSILHAASEMSSINCLRILIENKSALDLDLDLINESYGVSPLQRACAYGNFEVVRLLLKGGADPDLPSRDGLSPLFYSMEVLRLILTKARGLECMRILLRFGCNVNRKCAVRCRGSRIKFNMSHLAYALLSCNLYVARMLVVAGALKYEMSFSTEHEPAEIFPKELLSSPSDRDTFIKTQLQNPHPLFDLARYAVRQSLHRNVEEKIAELPLPEHIKNFLNLCEIDEIISDYTTKLESEDQVDEEYEDSISYEETDPEMDFTSTDSSEDSTIEDDTLNMAHSDGDNSDDDF